MTAKTADRHVLYERSVQCVEAEIDFVDRVYRKLRGKHAAWLREDFGGTGNTSSEWVRRRRTNHAITVDLDPDPLEWGHKHHRGSLPEEAQSRMTMLQEDVRTVDTRSQFAPMDVILAMNFSYWIFKERAEMIAYYRRVHEALADGGIFIMDACGGSEAHELREDTRELDGFDYIWDQAEFSPVTHDMTCYIHFAFPDGSKMKRAFTYRWRLWTLPEIQELLREAGFGKVTVYWEGTDRKTGEGNGVFRPSKRGEPCPSWIVYIVAEK